MNRETITLVVLALFLAITPLAFSQDGTPQPCPELTSQTLGCEPVAWSGLQEPEPVPPPEPDPKPEPPPDQQRDPPQPQAYRQSIAWCRVFSRRGETNEGEP